MKYKTLLFLTRFVPFKRIRKKIRKKIRVRIKLMSGESGLNGVSEMSEIIEMTPNLCYSQEGEDMILQRMFGNQESGFYVDVGAHHPFRYSNTALFYGREKSGWCGINIDPLPGMKILFDKHRPRDTNLEMGVAACSGILTYYMFKEPAYNTFDKQLADSRIQIGLDFEDKREISVIPLSEILDKYLPKDQGIDFMTIDVEGLDLEVIRSNDWEKYAPKVVIIEALDCRTIDQALIAPPVCVLKEYGYEVVSKTVNSVILQKAEFKAD